MDIQLIEGMISNKAGGFRCLTEYQPAGGEGDKIFPATYAGGKYAEEKRFTHGEGKIIDCVVIDSVQSQVNRMEEALLSAVRSGVINLPLMEVVFDDDRLVRKFTVSSLEAPHRIVDALFRDSKVDGVMFRSSRYGKILDECRVDNATGVFSICPTSLLFGFWDSTGPRGGSGTKMQRSIVSEIVGYDAVKGTKTSSRIDTAEIVKNAGPLYKQEGNDHRPHWTLEKGKEKVGKDGSPSGANHGNIPPDVSEGGFTISSALQTTVVSLPAIRRLRFPLKGKVRSRPEVDIAGQTVLATLGLLAGTMARNDTDLRSRCHLFPSNGIAWEVLNKPGYTTLYPMDEDEAVGLFNEAVRKAKDVGLPWDADTVTLTPSAELMELVVRSQQVGSQSDEG